MRVMAAPAVQARRCRAAVLPAADFPVADSPVAGVPEADVRAADSRADRADAAGNSGLEPDADVTYSADEQIALMRDLFIKRKENRNRPTRVFT